MVILARAGEGLALLAWVGWQYAVAALVARLWRRPARAWRRAIDRQGAAWFGSFARRHGGLMIKVGQFIASRPDAFPLTWVDACAALRDQAPARSPALVRQVLNEAFEGRIGDHFARIEDTPIASASFGQVHRAWLVNADGSDGPLVAVKIQHAGLAASVAVDLWLVRAALALAKPLLPGWPLGQLYQEIARTSRDEQDYLREGQSAERLRPGIEALGVRVPTVLWAHTRERVLTMAFAPGATLARTDPATLPETERQRLVGMIIDCALYMLLDVGFFHGDPHAGNWIYEPGRDGGPGTLWLIDFGMMAEIGARERAIYLRFTMALLRSDTDSMVDALFDLGVELPGADRSVLRGLAREIFTDLAQIDPSSFKGAKRQSVLETKISEFIRGLDGIVLPRHTMMLARASGLVEGVCLSLVPGSAMIDLMKPRLLPRVSWRRELRRQWEDLGNFWREVRRLPEQVAALSQARPAGIPPSILCALMLIAALLLPPSSARTWAAVAAASALAWSILRSR